MDFLSQAEDRWRNAGLVFIKRECTYNAYNFYLEEDCPRNLVESPCNNIVLIGTEIIL
jgi:hypothetical protein